MTAVRVATEGGSSVYGLSKSDRVFLYVVSGMTNPDDYTQATANGLPAKLATISGSGPDDPSCIVSAVRFVRSISMLAPYVELWAVYASTIVGGSAGFRRTSFQTEEWDTITVPNWTKHSPSVGPPYWAEIPKDSRLTLKRMRINRVHEIQTNGVSENTVADFDAAHAGKIRTMGSFKFRYLGSNLSTDPQNQQRIATRYQARQGIPAIAASYFAGNDAAVPALPVNSEYVPLFQNDPTVTPAIAVIDPDVFYGVCPAIPWDP